MNLHADARTCPKSSQPLIERTYKPCRVVCKTWPNEVSCRYIEEHCGRFGVELIWGDLSVSASAYHQRAKGEPSARAVEDDRLLERIRETHAKNYEVYGHRRAWNALLRACEQGPRCQVQRLMREHGIRSGS